MVALSENSIFEEIIRRVETTDLVLGGPPNTETGEAAVNVLGLLLANRTRWLKDAVAAMYTNDQIDLAIATAVGVLTAAEILTRVKTVDGAGSGLDADLLDGQHASAFLLKASLNFFGTPAAGGIAFPADPEGERLIFQWVTGLSATDGTMNLSLPTGFPTAVLGGLANEASPAGWGGSGKATVWAFDLANSTVSTAFARVRDIQPGTVLPQGPLGGRIFCWGI